MTTIRVLQAADTIGGNCIEITADNGERIFLDAGKPLDLPRNAVPAAPQGADPDRPCLGVLVSHAHQDHHGLLETLPGDWKIYCGKATGELLSLDAAIRGNSVKQPMIHWKPSVPLAVGPFTVTPFLTDHSAFDAYFLLIEADGRRILYTGDFRDQGRKGALTRKFLANPPEKIDVLVMEGTNLPGSDAVAKGTRSESELEDEFVRAFKATPGCVFITTSSANIDRLVTLFRACKKSGRTLVVDLYTMIVLRILGEYADSLPRPEWKGAPLMTVVTRRLARLAERLGHPGLVEELKTPGKAMSARRLSKDKHAWVVMIRSGMIGDYAGKGVVPDDGDAWIWSQWSGYLRGDGQKALFDFFGGRQPEIIHTSGHASPETLVKLARAVKPRMLIPVHGTEWRENASLFGDAPLRIVENGESVRI